jgi:hypothetical protein
MKIECNLCQGENGEIYLMCDQNVTIKFLSKDFSLNHFNLYEIEGFDKKKFDEYYKDKNIEDYNYVDDDNYKLGLITGVGLAFSNVMPKEELLKLCTKMYKKIKKN